MKISDAIARLKGYHRGVDSAGVAIDPATTRDQILYGDPDNECTGIVTTCWASGDVIRRAQELGANLIICHEALFWNRGDRTDWLEDNRVFQQKKALLDQSGIVVWRNHDYIHSGIPMGDGWVDGIFYGLMKVLGWENYLVGDVDMPMSFRLPPTKAKDLAAAILPRLGLGGTRILGDPEAMIENVMIPMHITGGDNDLITRVDSEKVDLLLTMELIDYTVSEYIRDAAQLGFPKAIIALGHFNCEEPGMKYMVEYLPAALGAEIPAAYVQSGDMYSYVIAGEEM